MVSDTLDISATTNEWQQRRYWISAQQPISVGYVMNSNRKAKPTDADLQAAARLRAIWDAIPRDRRPTQEQAAELLDINQSAVSQYRNGYIPLNARAVVLFAQLLGCKPTDIRDDLPELCALKDQKAPLAEPALRHQEEPTLPPESELNREWRELSHTLKAQLIAVVRLARQTNAKDADHSRREASAGLKLTKLRRSKRGKRKRVEGL